MSSSRQRMIFGDGPSAPPPPAGGGELAHLADMLRRCQDRYGRDRVANAIYASGAYEIGPAGPWTPGEPIPGHVITALEAPNRVYRVSGFSALGPGTTSNGLQLNWQQSGLVIGLRVSALGDGSADAMASLSIKITIADNVESIVTNGQSDDFVSAANLNGLQSQNPYPLRRFVYVNQLWTVTVKNTSASKTLTPEVSFDFKRDPESAQRSGLDGRPLRGGV